MSKGISKHQQTILSLLISSGDKGMRVPDIAASTLTRNYSVTRALTSLLRRGLVVKEEKSKTWFHFEYSSGTDVARELQEQKEKDRANKKKAREDREYQSLSARKGRLDKTIDKTLRMIRVHCEFGDYDEALTALERMIGTHLKQITNICGFEILDAYKDYIQEALPSSLMFISGKEQRIAMSLTLYQADRRELMERWLRCEFTDELRAEYVNLECDLAVQIAKKMIRGYQRGSLTGEQFFGGMRRARIAQLRESKINAELRDKRKKQFESLKETHSEIYEQRKLYLPPYENESCWKFFITHHGLQFTE
ncbi:MarR family transcriptional regulator [Endozoicomonas arenosclerae]|uniref:MarR family transcriptional regulator n=1 Tax=Endozoicomonas arenosclerae TaxID=1633495 RepID=UPI0007812CD8|nr:MarR family transcriptional regulator [Endozoicomonas arenosclerae]